MLVVDFGEQVRMYGRLFPGPIDALADLEILQFLDMRCSCSGVRIPSISAISISSRLRRRSPVIGRYSSNIYPGDPWPF
jgi:hypothetical protein